MPALKLFISHSSILDEIDGDGRPLARNWDLLANVCARLRDHYGNDKIKILVDVEGLLPASDWRARLNDWLGDCDAAIILFSKRALQDSNWVKFEASVLSWRKSRDPGFTLIPVLLDGEATPEDLEADIWNTIRIANSQCVRSAATADDVLAGVNSALGNLSDRDRQACFGNRFRTIRTLISECEASTTSEHAEAMQDVWEALAAGDLPGWPIEPVKRYALALTGLLFEDTERSMQTFADIMKAMHPPFKRTRELFDYVRPLWVNAIAADNFKGHLKQNPLVALNGDYVAESDGELGTRCYTLDRYLERALLASSSVKVVHVPTPDADVVRSEIRSSFDKRWKTCPPYKVEQLDTRIRNTSTPIIALIPASNADALDERRIDDLLGLKAEACPALVCVFAPGRDMPSALPPSVQPVEPILDPQAEYEHYLNERDARDVLQNH
jgi:TIR domain-containing protein